MSKRIIAFICVLALLLGTPIASVEAASATDTYRVGFSKVDVTPTITNPTSSGLGMGGYGDTANRQAVGVMTPQFLKEAIESGESGFSTTAANNIPDTANTDMYHLYASCIAITDHVGATVLLFTMDLIALTASHSLTMRKAVSEATGVPEENITITCTHTHSAPALSSSSSYPAIDDWRLDVVMPGLIKAAKDALDDRSDATLYQGAINATDMVKIRHYGIYSDENKTYALLDAEGKPHVQGSNFGSMYSGTKVPIKDADDAMHLLMFKTKTGDPIVLCNFRAHPCNDSISGSFNHDSHDGYRMISSDYIGPLRDAVENAGYRFAFFQGSAGNVVTTNDETSYTYGTKLATFAIQGISNNLSQVSAGPIQTKRVDMSADLLKPEEMYIEPAQKVQALYEDLLDGNNKVDDSELANLVNTKQYEKTKITSAGLIQSNGYVTVKGEYNKAVKNKVITASEAHTVCNALARSYGLGSRYHANNIVSTKDNSGTKTIQLNAITLGNNLAIVTNPSELFDDLSQDLADYYGKRTFVFGYTNGSTGYLPNEAAFKYNATELEDGTIIYGGSYETHTTDYAMGTGAKVATTLKNMLDSMKTTQFCPCVGTHTDSGSCKEVSWEPWDSSTSLPDSGNYYLTKDVTVTGSTELQGTLNLDLRGRTVKGTSIYNLASGDHLVVTDSYSGGQLGLSGIPITAKADSTLTVYAGTIGGTVKNNGATVNLWGTPSVYISMAKGAPAMNCQGLQVGARVYVVGALEQRFAKVSSVDQKACFILQNEYSSRYANGSLYLTSKQYHCVCVGTLDGMDTDHVCKQVSWQPWNETDSLPTTTGNYYLTSNVYLTEEQEIAAGATVRLDLSGKTVYVGRVLNEDKELVLSEKGIRALFVNGSSTLEITNSTGAGRLEGVASAPTEKKDNDSGICGGVIYVNSDCTLNLYSNITINGNRYGSESTASAFKRVTAVNRGGCVYSKGNMTMYGGTIANGSAWAGDVSRAGGNVYTSGTFAMYGGKIHLGVGSGQQLYVGGGSATIGGNAFINGGVRVYGSNKLILTGAPHIPVYTYTDDYLHGITLVANANNQICTIDATGLDAEAMAQTAPDGSASHSININDEDAQIASFAKVNTPAQAAFFSTHNSEYGVHCNAAGDVSMYKLDADNRYGCLCGGKLMGSENHTCSTITWKPWTNASSLPTEGNYYLAADVTASACTTVTGILNLDLNGHTVTATSRVFDVKDNAALRITDSGSNGTIDATNSSVGKNTGNKNYYQTPELDDSQYCGGMILMSKGTFELYGGTLIGASNPACFVAKGGILYALGTDTNNRATVNIYGGTLKEGYAYYGGAIALKSTNLTIYDGTITDCSGCKGGSIHQSTFTKTVINGGTIANGTTNPHYTYAANSNDPTVFNKLTKNNSSGGNICVTGGTITISGGMISGGSATESNGNGGNLYFSSGNTSHKITGGTITGGSAVNVGDNIGIVNSKEILTISGGLICDPVSGSNVGLYGGSVVVSGGVISGGSYGIKNGNKGGNTTLKGNPVITGSTCGIFMNDSYYLNETTGEYEKGYYAYNSQTGAYDKLTTDDSSCQHATLAVEESFTGTADVFWGPNTIEALGITQGNEIDNTTSQNYNATGNLTFSNLNVPLVGSDGGKLVIMTTAIVDGDGIVSYHPSFSDALSAYALAADSSDQKYIQLLCDQTGVEVTESIHLDLNGHDLSVTSVSSDCKIYGMDSATNQYTRYDVEGEDICGKLTLPAGSETCIVKDVVIRLTKGTTEGTRKYLAMQENGSYTFHRYYLSLIESGLRPQDAGIFYNAVFYGDEAFASAVTKYGVQVSSKENFAENTTASTDYQQDLGAFRSGVTGNKGFRTVLYGILSEDNVTPVVDYSTTDIYGRAYITVDGVTLYCSNTGSTNLQTIIRNADTAYGKNALSAAQKDALDTMYSKYRSVMRSWNILKHIGHVEIDINDLLATDPKSDDELNILLIGNSFCFYWVEELYGLLAEGSGYAADKINITNVYYSGCPLKNHWNWLEAGVANYNIAVTTKDGRAYDDKAFYDLNSVLGDGEFAKNWDFISLQQNSGAFYDGDYVGELTYARETLEPYLGNLLSYLRAKYPKAQYMWHQFWAHEIGYSDNFQNEADRTAFHDAMVSIGGEVSQLHDMTIVPTGEAWELVRDNSNVTNSTLLSDTNLTAALNNAGISEFTLCTRINNSKTKLMDDLYHDGDIGGGQFLNACVWYEKITGKSVLDTTYAPSYEFQSNTYKLSDTLVSLLKYAAHAAVAKYTPNGDPSQDNETNILLIGNSFSYWWTDELAGMLTAAGYPNVSVYNVYASGCTLDAHWTSYQSNATQVDINHDGKLVDDEKLQLRKNNTLEKTGISLYDCITKKNWDVISLQQSGSYVYGSTGSLDKFVTNSDPYAKNLLSTLRGMFPQAEYYWLQNWAHEIYESGTHTKDTGIADLAKRQKIAGIFREGSRSMCQKYALSIVPCGDAWELVRDNTLVNSGIYDLTSRAKPSDSMYTDGRHDGDYYGGQYLNACVWFETITKTSCLDNTFIPSYNNNGTKGNLTSERIELLKQGAHDAVAAVYGTDYAK